MEITNTNTSSVKEMEVSEEGNDDSSMQNASFIDDDNKKDEQSEQEMIVGNQDKSFGNLSSHADYSSSSSSYDDDEDSSSICTEFRISSINHKKESVFKGVLSHSSLQDFIPSQHETQFFKTRTSLGQHFLVSGKTVCENEISDFGCYLPIYEMCMELHNKLRTTKDDHLGFGDLDESIFSNDQVGKFKSFFKWLKDSAVVLPPLLIHRVYDKIDAFSGNEFTPSYIANYIREKHLQSEIFYNVYKAIPPWARYVQDINDEDATFGIKTPFTLLYVARDNTVIIPIYCESSSEEEGDNETTKKFDFTVCTANAGDLVLLLTESFSVLSGTVLPLLFTDKENVRKNFSSLVTAMSVKFSRKVPGIYAYTRDNLEEMCNSGSSGSVHLLPVGETAATTQRANWQNDEEVAKAFPLLRKFYTNNKQRKRKKKEEEGKKMDQTNLQVKGGAGGKKRKRSPSVQEINTKDYLSGLFKKAVDFGTKYAPLDYLKSALCDKKEIDIENPSNNEDLEKVKKWAAWIKKWYRVSSKISKQHKFFEEFYKLDKFPLKREEIERVEDALSAVIGDEEIDQSRRELAQKLLDKFQETIVFLLTPRCYSQASKNYITFMQTVDDFLQGKKVTLGKKKKAPAKRKRMENNKQKTIPATTTTTTAENKPIVSHSSIQKEEQEEEEVFPPQPKKRKQKKQVAETPVEAVSQSAKKSKDKKRSSSSSSRNHQREKNKRKRKNPIVSYSEPPIPQSQKKKPKVSNTVGTGGLNGNNNSEERDNILIAFNGLSIGEGSSIVLCGQFSPREQTMVKGMITKWFKDNQITYKAHSALGGSRL